MCQLEVGGVGTSGKSISVSVRVVRAGEAKLRGRESSFPAVTRGVGQNVPGPARRPADVGRMLGDVGRMLGGVGPVLGPCWPVLGVCWAVLGVCWGR